MIISRTPFRISFFGGGTDHLDYFKKKPGTVLSTTIDRYCYISISKSPPFSNYNYQISWSKIEKINSVEDIEHPSIRNSIKLLKFKEGLSVFHRGDLPARSGMGSSSAFTVAFLNGIKYIQNKKEDKHNLALEAQYVESILNKEKVGFQDQFAASFGGINQISFNYLNNEPKIDVKPIKISNEFKKEIESSIVLCYLDTPRNASTIEKAKFENDDFSTILNEINESSKSYINEFKQESGIENLGRNLNNLWNLKKKLHNSVSNEKINQLYNLGIKHGALGGKVLGAGGGGFLLFIVPKIYIEQFKNEITCHTLNISFENRGAVIFDIKGTKDD